jgi:hypothetical protein
VTSPPKIRVWSRLNFKALYAISSRCSTPRPRLPASKRISQNGHVRLLSPIFLNLHQTTFRSMRQWRNQQLTVVNRIGKVLTTSTLISLKSQASVVSQRQDSDGNHLEVVIPSLSITATSAVHNGVELRKAMK